MNITYCPPGYAWGYGDKGTYVAIPFVGKFECGEFIPNIFAQEHYASTQEARYMNTMKQQRENPEKRREYYKEWYKKRKRAGLT